MEFVTIFLEILWTVVLPIFILIALGALMGKRLGLDADTLSKVNLYALGPALVFTKFMASDIEWAGIGLITLYWCFLMVVLWVLSAGLSAILGMAPERRPILQVVAMFPNAGNFGIPVAELAYGPAAVAVQAVTLIIHNFLLFTVGAFLTAGGLKAVRGALVAVLKLPMIYASAAALLLRGHENIIPPPLLSAVDYLGLGLIPMALLTLGGQLATGKKGPPPGDSASAVGIRLIASPVIGWGLCLVLGIPAPLSWYLILAASGPSAVNTVLLAIEFRRDASFASSAVFWTTIISPLTVSLVLALCR